MSFEEAMLKAHKLELDVWRAIALRLSPAERRSALLAYINFNPFMVLVQEFRDNERS